MLLQTNRLGYIKQEGNVYKYKKRSSVMFLNKKIFLISLLTTLPLLATRLSFTATLALALYALTIVLCIVAAIASIIFIATSKLEWALLKNTIYITAGSKFIV